MAMPDWTAEELAKPVAPRRIGGDEHHTEFLIHLGTAEKPHTHDQHDLAVTLISGGGRIHIGDTVTEMRPGDVMRIPRGVPHWAENTAPGGSVAYAVFTPAYDGTDTHPLPAP
jgi:quercetin dioxygenase-like cupin family protein